MSCTCKFCLWDNVMMCPGIRMRNTVLLFWKTKTNCHRRISLPITRTYYYLFISCSQEQKLLKKFFGIKSDFNFVVKWVFMVYIFMFRSHTIIIITNFKFHLNFTLILLLSSNFFQITFFYTIRIIILYTNFVVVFIRKT